MHNLKMKLEFRPQNLIYIPYDFPEKENKNLHVQNNIKDMI